MITVKAFLDQKGHHVHTMNAEDTVIQAARVMTEQGIGCVVVMKGDAIDGMFTERDMVRDVVLERRPPEDTPLADVMTSPVATCQLEDTLRDCALMMQEQQIRRLPVADDGRLVGIVTARDVFRSQLQNKDATIEDLVQHIFTAGVSPRA
jgi:CBS domain-containing protein